MRIRLSIERKARSARHGFTLLEVMVAFFLIGGMALTLYLGMSQGFAVIQLARENLRATQILQEKMEAIRLVSWEQINTPDFVPRYFTAPFYAADDGSTESSNGGGLTYTGQVTISNVPFSESYSSDLRLVVAEVAWRSGDVLRRRSMRTLVSEYGLQNYIYDPQ